MNYDDKTDDEIESDVMEAIHGEAVNYWALSDDGSFIYYFGHAGDQYYQIDVIHPCSNPSDAWPIILEHNMDIELAHPLLGSVGTITIYNPKGTDWQVDFTDNNKALRAAMICFLKMKDLQK